MAPMLPKLISSPVARVWTMTSTPSLSFSSGLKRRMARKRPSPEKAAEAISSRSTTVPARRSMSPRLLRMVRSASWAASRSSSDTPMEKASQFPSGLKRGVLACGTTTTESESVRWMRSSRSSSTRRTPTAIHDPSGEKVLAPRRSHWA